MLAPDRPGARRRGTYGPWELVTSLLTEALVARGVDVTLFATQRFDHRGHARWRGARAAYAEDPELDAKVWEMPHLAHLFEQAGELRPDPQPGRFPRPCLFATLVDTPMVTTIHGFSVRAHPADVQALRGPGALCRDQRGRPASGVALCRDASITASASTNFPFEPRWQRGPAVLRPHASRQGRRPEAIAGRSRHRAALNLYGIVQDQGYFDREVAPFLDERIAYHGPVGGAERLRALGSAQADAPPDQLRRAVRPVGDRGNGLRHAR